MSGESDTAGDVAAGRDRLVVFRQEFYRSLVRRRDALFELCDAVRCANGPVTSLPELSLEPVHRRGHGSTYAALSAGRVDVLRVRRSLAELALPRSSTGQLRLAVDVTPWPRPDAQCSPDRAHCHRPCRCDGVRQTIPGWPYSFVMALKSGRSSWTGPLDALRIGPDDELTEVTAAQLREVVQRLQAAGQHADDDPPILVVMDAGYDVVRLAWLLRDLPVQLLARVRSDRVFYPAADGAVGRQGGRPRRHGQPVKLSEETTWPDQDVIHTSVHERYGAVTVTAWAGLHQRLTRRAGWQHHSGPLPIVAGTLILVLVDRLPGDRAPKPVWLWHSDPQAADLDLARIFATFLRRFDAEHTFRFLKQVLGWTKPRVRTGEQADRWTWLILAAYTQLRLARYLAEDLRRPWEPPLRADQLTPGRVRRGFRRIRRTAGCPARAPKPTRPGPGRPKGSHNSHPTPRYPVGKQSKVDTPKPERCNRGR